VGKMQTGSKIKFKRRRNLLMIKGKVQRGGK
jgi:hypothetical protein